MARGFIPALNLRNWLKPTNESRMQMHEMAQRTLRGGARLVVRRRLDLTVEGLEHLPRRGPAIIAARHFHHLYDGCALVATIPRPVQILVALDWIERGTGRRAMDQACRLAGWPTVVRTDPVSRERWERLPAAARAEREASARRALRRATAESIALLRAGRLLLIFPEGYPNVDPGFTPKADAEAFLPFQPGFVRLAALAEKDGQTRVPIVPAGFRYEHEPERGARWRVALRFGEPVFAGAGTDVSAAVEVVEERVRALSMA
jgi:putative membrane protein